MSDPTPWRVLVVAKAPVPGRAKTRLAVDVGDDAAARLASAALLDTLAAAGRAVGPERCVLALTGDLDDAADGGALRAALRGWRVVPQRGDAFDERLAHAHADAGAGAVVQVGMDTPQLTPALLAQAAAPLRDHDAALGPAEDGGWWVLGRRDPSVAQALRGVPMSRPTTHDDTRDALVARGCTVATVPALRDVDDLQDAAAVAALAPGTRFAAVWAGVRGRAAS